MVTIELNDEEVAILKGLLTKKIEGTKWVIENKSPKNADKLQQNMDTQQKILDKLGGGKEEE
jgi:hypothetical protein